MWSWPGQIRANVLHRDQWSLSVSVMGLWFLEGEVRGWGQMEVGDGGGGSRPSSSRGLRVREHSGDMKGPTPKGTLVLRSGDLQSHSPSPTCLLGFQEAKETRGGLPSPTVTRSP